MLTPDGQPLTDVERLVVRKTHACAFRSTGELLCWGRNTEAELGDGTMTNVQLPIAPVLTCQ